MADDSWRTHAFRQNVVTKIEEAIRQSGMNTSRNSIEMENHVFQKAKNKEEYLSFVARLILHVREMNTKKGQPGAMSGVPGGQQQQAPGMPDPINALQNLASQGTEMESESGDINMHDPFFTDLEDVTMSGKRKRKSEATEETFKQGDSDQDIIRERIAKKAILDGKFFEVKQIRGFNGFKAICKTCQPKIKNIKGSIIHTTNFINHLKWAHRAAYIEYLEYKKEKKERARNENNISKTILQNFMTDQQGPKTITKADFENRLIKFVINTMSPLSIVEHPSFKQLFDGFILEIVTGNTLTRRISELFQERQAKLKSDLLKVKYVCTTVDIWSGKNTSFIGVTCHWINDDFSRQSVTLACQRFKGSHSYDRIANILVDIHMKYGLDTNKIVATVTDNGSNFVKSFKEFGITLPDSSSTEDDFIEIGENLSSDKYEFDDQDSKKITFVIIGDEGEVIDGQHKLPNHLRCASHTINLICTADCNKVLISNDVLKLRHYEVMAKCNRLWKKAAFPKSAEIILETLGHRLSYPEATRWNSYYDSISNILKCKSEMIDLFQRLNLKKCFDESEFLYLEEFCQVMEPLALDVLQGEANNFYGLLLPCLASLKNKLDKLSRKHFHFASPFLEACLDGLQTRFKLFFTLDLQVQGAVIASVVHPQFKLRWYNIISKAYPLAPNLTSIEEILLNEANNFIEVEESNESDDETVACDTLSAFFDFDESESSERVPGTSFPQKENLKRNKVELEYFRYISDPRTNLKMLNDYPTIKKMFMKYNTPLASSAAVERLFSFAAIINSPRRHNLSDTIFEKLVVLKNCI